MRKQRGESRLSRQNFCWKDSSLSPEEQEAGTCLFYQALRGARQLLSPGTPKEQELRCQGPESTSAQSTCHSAALPPVLISGFIREPPLIEHLQ